MDLLGIRPETQVTADVLRSNPALAAVGARCIGTTRSGRRSASEGCRYLCLDVLARCRIPPVTDTANTAEDGSLRPVPVPSLQVLSRVRG
jgi:hypothetical protein